MKYFEYIKNKKMFFKKPKEVLNSSDLELLKYSLGATLYMPATREDIDDIIINNKIKELTSMVICLEDSVSDYDLEYAEENLINIFEKLLNYELNYGEINLPLIFIRIRNPKHFIKILSLVKNYKKYILGFVFPKFDYKSGVEYLKILKEENINSNKKYYYMPVLESKKIIYRETRMDELLKLSVLFKESNSELLNIRIGGTDFSSLFGLRRSRDFTIYDINVINDCLTDILNFFTREKLEYVISGVVWEYFSNNERILKPLLRNTIFNEYLGERGISFRKNLIKNNLDTLIGEILLDKENGIIGKTVIHPSHIELVNALYTVTKEEYMDAISIINSKENGVIKSKYNNKMNEIKPHVRWAKRILNRAKVYGVLDDGYDFISILMSEK